MSNDFNRRMFLKQSVTVSAGVASGLGLGQKASAAMAKEIPIAPMSQTNHKGIPLALVLSVARGDEYSCLADANDGLR